jgi:hypothetical protein
MREMRRGEGKRERNIEGRRRCKMERGRGRKGE